ncbi:MULTISPECIES: hypothetical protein [unclassified Sphingopyxis]|uniref:hypothetical protein n=1 Tax=unclassified Sphingopyxis TaxID=2614943 RepID=UPI0007376FA7|nr:MULTISPECIES: hypothetical protein [unclassified Sphingopyxis]KTE29509.1 hypothetical protein ATE62_20980 [Sphingopyxis sp. HIX]KTE79290.1 hypothetical protein ATE72_19135 [Sphingopyxis sp. HXXIV]
MLGWLRRLWTVPATAPEQARTRQKFLFKANDAILSFCRCEGEPAMSGGQLDCPWCGCGWMIACSKCSKSFIFAEVRETDVPLIELGRREVARRGLRGVTEQDIADWAEDMAADLAPFAAGDIVAYLDGSYFRLDATDIEFDGYYAAHKLARLPHAEALDDPPRLQALLGDRRYWLDRERPDRA